MTGQLGVIVVTYNSSEVIRGLIDSLDAGLGHLRWQLVVVDNDSTDDTVDVVRQASSRALVIEAGANRGYAAGINAGVARLNCVEAYLILNPDVRLGEGCVPRLLSALESPGAGIAVPRLEDGQGQLIETMRREPSVGGALADAMLGTGRAGRWLRLGEMVTSHAEYDHAQCTDWAEGSTMLVSRACMEECGPWNESFFLYSEETDFALRARDAGYATRYVPEARAVHLEGDSKASAPLWSLLVTNKVRLFRMRHGLVMTLAYWGVLLIRELSRAIVGRETSRLAVRSLVRPATWRGDGHDFWAGLNRAS